MAGAISLKEIEVLPNGIGRSPVPVEANPLLAFRRLLFLGIIASIAKGLSKG